MSTHSPTSTLHFCLGVFLLVICLFFGSLSPLLASPPAPSPIPWDISAQGSFLTCLCRDMQGHVWAGTEDSGVSRYDPAAPEGKRWTRFAGKDGPGDDVYALVCDRKGRVWAGTGTGGVAVYNGRAWRSYDRLTGPLGAHVTALAVSPHDGGVWMGSEQGVARYAGGRWTYVTRADGLPSDQISSLAFGADGTLYVGTQGNGIAVGSARDSYHAWRVIPGPASLPNAPVGKGLPSALINCLLVGRDGTVWAGTPVGLARSGDVGQTWTFRRGEDWAAKAAGRTHPVVPAPVTVPGDLLREDYVTCLAEDGAGHLLVGHWAAGLEAWDAAARLWPGPKDAAPSDDIAALLPLRDGGVLTAKYGGGLARQDVPGLVPPKLAAAPLSDAAADFPVPAAPPTLAELRAMRARVERLTQPLPVGGGTYEGEDWVTQGDWTGRYGSRVAVLCADAAPLDQAVLSDPSYKVEGRVGPHGVGGEGLRHWAYRVQPDDPRVLWDPVAGCRREGEWDDHGETYPQTSEGPDVWVTATVPAGLHRLSLYLMNVNGHNLDRERWRDYRLELKAYPSDAADLDAQPALATARAHGFWGGVYERFLVRGPGRFAVKVGRNGSLNAILQSILLDKLSGPPTPYETRRSVWYGKDVYHPPAAPTNAASSPTVAAARGLWDALDQSAGEAGAYRLLAYRAVAASEPAESWRWQLALWDPADRETFHQAMAANWQSLLDANPKLALGNQ